MHLDLSTVSLAGFSTIVFLLCGIGFLINGITTYLGSKGNQEQLSSGKKRIGIGLAITAGSMVAIYIIP